MWNRANGIEPDPQFEVKIATVDGQPVMANNQVPIMPHCSINDVEAVDLIIIPSQGMDICLEGPDFEQRVEWVKHWYERGANIASACSGVFTLAATGLLDGKTATTHWGAEKMFKELFPKVTLRTDLMVTHEERLFCGGGMTAEFNLALYLVRFFCGREIAIQSSRCTLVEMDKMSQTTFSVFTPEKLHQDDDMLSVQDWMEDNLSQSISVELLASRVNMSPRHFNRRFKKATGETALNYLQLIRIEAAKKQLEATEMAFDDIAFNLGYTNVSFFRSIFKRSTGLTPMEYKNKFPQYLTVKGSVRYQKFPKGHVVEANTEEAVIA